VDGAVAEGPLAEEFVQGRANVVESVRLEPGRAVVEHMLVVGLALGMSS